MYDIELYFHTAQSSHCGKMLAADGDPSDLHGIEVYNGNSRHNSHNDLALQAAKEYKLGMIAGLDFHQPKDLSDRRVGFIKMPQTEQELAGMLKQREFTIV